MTTRRQQPKGNPPVMPITLLELMSRARNAYGATPQERVYRALQADQDTAEWLEAIRPFAFQKGLTRMVIPSARSKYQEIARSATVNTIFAFAKNVRPNEVKIPGTTGKVQLTEADMIDPGAQYGLTDGSSDLAALAALHDLRAVTYAAQEGPAQPDRDWAHAESELEGLDQDLARHGVHAGTAKDALELLLLNEEADFSLMQALERKAGVTESEARTEVRDYGRFKTTAWYAPDGVTGESIVPNVIPPKVMQALEGAVFVDGNWDELEIPAHLKPEAFDRLVDLFAAALAQYPKSTVIAANTDDLTGKAAIMAARRQGKKTVAVQLAGWDLKPAHMQARYCQEPPRGKDAVRARADLRVMIAELVRGAITLTNEQVLTHNLTVHGKRVKNLHAAWTKHNGLY